MHGMICVLKQSSIIGMGSSHNFYWIKILREEISDSFISASDQVTMVSCHVYHCGTKAKIFTCKLISIRVINDMAFHVTNSPESIILPIYNNLGGFLLLFFFMRNDINHLQFILWHQFRGIELHMIDFLFEKVIHLYVSWWSLWEYVQKQHVESTDIAWNEFLMWHSARTMDRMA